MIFELKNISLSFDKRILFENLNITFKGPKIIGLLGPSGCGKSTLIRLLAGLQKPNAGELKGPILKQGFIFQDSHLLDWRTTFENVMLPLELQGLTQPDKVQKALASVGLEEAQKLYPWQLSGGMKMRASFARAFVTEPKILFCDEPFAALDEVTRENLQQNLRTQVVKNESMCFFVTHNLTEALRVCDEIYHFTSPGQLETTPFLVNQGHAAGQQVETLRSLVHGSFK